MTSDQPNLLYDLALAPKHLTKCWKYDALSVRFGSKAVIRETEAIAAASCIGQDQTLRGSTKLAAATSPVKRQ